MLNEQYQSAVDALLNGDLDAFNEQAQRQATFADKREQFRMEAEAKLVQAALSTPDGKKFLHWLIGKTLLRAMNDAQTVATTAEAHSIAAARREGQNQIVAMIIDALRFARGEAKEMPNADV